MAGQDIRIRIDDDEDLAAVRDAAEAQGIALEEVTGVTPSTSASEWDEMASSASVTDASVAAVIPGPGPTRTALESIFGTFRSAVPTSGTYAVNDIVWNTLPTAGGFIGWVCVTAGTPGTWKGFGLIES